MLVVVLGLVWCAAAVPAAPGYQLGEPRTNAVGIGAAAAWSAGTAFVVGGSGDETRGPGPSGAGGFVFRDSKLFQVAARSWSSLQPLPLGQQRAFHSLHQLDADRTLLFGGSRDNDFLSDLWVYSRATNLWTPLTPVAGSSPPGRAGHAARVVGGSLWVFGGVGAGGVLLNDAWSFSLTSLVWRQALATNRPSPRYLHVAFLSGTTSVCLFGGSESAASAALLATVPASTAVFCLDTALPDGSYTSESPTGAVSVAAASIAETASEVAVVGGVAGGAVAQLVQRFSLSSRTWTVQGQASARAYAASAYSPAQGILWLFGGLNSTGGVATTVLAVGPQPSWTATVAGCEPGYTGSPQCSVPVCRDNCWGVGRCIAPDLCECLHGFTGPLCSQQQCTTCGLGLLPLNQPIYWPRARAKALACIAGLTSTIRAILAALPGYPETCAQTFLAQSFPLNVTAVSRTAWDFRTGPASLLVTTTAQTLQLLKR